MEKGKLNKKLGMITMISIAAELAFKPLMPENIAPIIDIFVLLPTSIVLWEWSLPCGSGSG